MKQNKELSVRHDKYRNVYDAEYRIDCYSPAAEKLIETCGLGSAVVSVTLLVVNRPTRSAARKDVETLSRVVAEYILQNGGIK